MYIKTSKIKDIEEYGRLNVIIMFAERLKLFGKLNNLFYSFSWPDRLTLFYSYNYANFNSRICGMMHQTYFIYIKRSKIKDIEEHV